MSASSHRGNYIPGNVNDGIVSDPSRWLAEESDPKPWVQLAFPQPMTVGMIDVFSGWKKDLERIAMGAIDHVFGRNPMLHAAPSHPDQGFPEVERGWPKQYKHDVCARLETVRGNIASLPGSPMYPFNPGVGFRHLEGWANYGASWCISLSYLRFDAMSTTPDMER